MKLKYFILLILMLLYSNGIYAHPPEKISLEFNKETHILKVVMQHPVEDAGKHIVNKITVKMNGNEAVTQKFTVQLNKEKQEAVFLIPGLKSGDKIEVTATCNVFGKKKETFDIS